MHNLHLLNIFLHITAGISALIAGFLAIGARKGSKKHIRSGRYFLLTTALVIFTGLIGVFVFKRNTFLLVITLLSGYTAYSGIRTIRLRGSRPRLTDQLVSIIVLASGIYYVYYIKSIGFFWSPAIIYSTLGALALVAIFDLSKSFLPKKILRSTIVYEHIYKMTSSLIALVSAFTGTVLPQYKPYSQLFPTIFGLVYIVSAMIGLAKRKSAHSGNCNRTIIHS